MCPCQHELTDVIKSSRINASNLALSCTVRAQTKKRCDSVGGLLGLIKYLLLSFDLDVHSICDDCKSIFIIFVSAASLECSPSSP